MELIDLHVYQRSFCQHIVDALGVRDSHNAILRRFLILLNVGLASTALEDPSVHNLSHALISSHVIHHSAEARAIDIAAASVHTVELTARGYFLLYRSWILNGDAPSCRYFSVNPAQHHGNLSTSILQV
eukprot:6492719-Amphidinium_carterae.1